MRGSRVIMSARSAILFLFVVSIAAPAWAETAHSLGKTGDWESFTYSDKAGKVCYATARPQRSQHAPKGRSATYISVTHRPAEKSIGIINVTGGYVYKKDEPAVITIDGHKFEIYTSADTAWSRNDKAVLQAMSKGKSLQISGTPAKGEPSLDLYSLEGFGAAYAAIGKACAVK